MTPLLSAKILAKVGIAALPLAALASPLQLGLAEKKASEIPTVTIAARDFSYRTAGSFTRVNLPVNGPVVHQR